jgi:HD superfamily phosphodiesterase
VKKNTHPERGEGSFGEIIETMAGHDLNHVKQVEAITRKLAAA